MAYLLWQVTSGLFFLCNFVASPESAAGSSGQGETYPLRQVWLTTSYIALSHHLGTPSTFDAGHPQAL